MGDGKITCGKTKPDCQNIPIINLDHPLHEGISVCKEHEPNKCNECDGHILGGECHCY